MLYLGIDPGESGAWAIIDDSCNIIAASLYKNSSILPPDKLKCFAVIEKVHAMPMQGVTSMFTFAENFGKWQGYLTGVGIPFTLVTPQKWQKEILDFQIAKEDVLPVELPKEKKARAARNRAKLKEGIVEFVKRRIPASVELLKLKKDQDIADALCLALYARKTYQPSAS